MTTDTYDTKRIHILRHATRLFADRGYDKTGISAIAKAAQVNSALIYYYFKNKDAVLAEIIETFVAKANGFLIEMAGKGYAFDSPETQAQMKRYEDFLLSNEDVLRIMMMESLKGGTTYPPLFRLIDFQADGLEEGAVVKDLNDRGFKLDEDPMKRRVSEFFTGIVPQVAYSLFRAKWCDRFGIEPEVLDTLYKDAVDETHGAHHR